MIAFKKKQKERKTRVRISTNSHGRKRKKKKMSYICKSGQGAEKNDVRIFNKEKRRTHIQQVERKEGKHELIVHSSKDEAKRNITFVRVLSNS